MDVELIQLNRLNPEEPLGLAYIAAVLRQSNINVSISDFHFSKDLALFGKRLDENSPDFVGISCINDDNHANLAEAVSTAVYAKRKSPNIKTVIGGPAVFFREHSDILRIYPEVDFVVRGEGEYAMLNLVNGVDLYKIPNLIFRENKQIIKTPVELISDLDALPFPARELLKNKYKPHAKHVIASRGCNENCVFCEYRVEKGKQRRRTWTNVFSEIELLLKNQEEKQSVLIEDENFLPNARGFLEEKKKRNLNFKFAISSKLPRFIEYKDVFLECLDNGLSCVEGGIENPVHNEVLHKGFGKQTIKDAFRFLSSIDENAKSKEELHLFNHNFYGIMFVKETTPESILKNCEFYKNLFIENPMPYLAICKLENFFDILRGKVILSYDSPLFKSYKNSGVKIFPKLLMPAKKIKYYSRISKNNLFSYNTFSYVIDRNLESPGLLFGWDWAMQKDVKQIYNEFLNFSRNKRESLESIYSSIVNSIYERECVKAQDEFYETRLSPVLEKIHLFPIKVLEGLARQAINKQEIKVDLSALEILSSEANNVVEEFKAFPLKERFRR